jgi:hypothetical protein
MVTPLCNLNRKQALLESQIKLFKKKVYKLVNGNPNQEFDFKMHAHTDVNDNNYTHTLNFHFQMDMSE